MSKQLLISIQPQHLYNILTGKKTLEIRKQLPKGFVGWVNCYCTKGKPYLTSFCGRFNLFDKITDNFKFAMLNGSIPCRFWFDEYEEIKYEVILPNGYENHDGEWIDNSAYGYWLSDYITEKSMLNDDEFEDYGNGKNLYAMHIKKLEIFDKPKALSEFRNTGRYKLNGVQLKSVWKEVTHAPQSYMYVEVEE